MSTTISHTASPAAQVRLNRPLGVAAATIAALAVWVLAVPFLGIQLMVRFGNGAPQSVGIGFVAGASLAGSLLGWGLLVLLERRTRYAITIWTRVAIVVALVSLSLPLSAGTTMSNRFALALMHLAVASVLIVVLRRSAPAHAALVRKPARS